jgi:CheY-like chemotaxis protein/anti-sigma regulatory factor (Ser/Thr protein kinase)
MADPIRVDQVVGNLLTNAIKYTPPGKRIHITVGREGDDAVVRVADEGIGIPMDLAPRIFDLFVQGSRPLDRSSGGLGIGLTLVRRLVEMHGGRVEVSSRGEGQGSTFTIRLPAIEAPASPEPRDEHHGADGRDILLIEDNEDARETLETLLRLKGHEVRTAPDGPSGLAAALSERPGVMLVDLGLPGLDGLEVARRVRADGGWAQRPLMVALTGYGQDEDRQRAIEAGFDAHVTKPVSMDALDRLLERAPPISSASGPAPGVSP